LAIQRSGLYYKPVGISESNLALMKAIDRQYLEAPFYGSRKIAVCLKKEGQTVNRKRIRRLMRLMGLKAIYRRPRTSPAGKGNKIYPYLLKGLKINRPNQVWAADITYIHMQKVFLYLVVIMDWYSRYVLSWRLSNTLESDFCVEALKEPLKRGCPEIFNTDQGSQFTSPKFVSLLEGQSVQVSMDGSGRYTDNLFIERLWRTLKYEEVYLKTYQNAIEARSELARYIAFYNAQRPHQSLGYRTPAEEYYACTVEVVKEGMLISVKPRSTFNPVRIAGPHFNLE
jgi:putative transposase